MKYIPIQGDIIMMDFDPQKGHEQRGRRPALIVSNNTYNQHCKLSIVCPITSTDIKHAFHVPIDNNAEIAGVILCDQVRSMDVIARNAEYVSFISDDLLDKVIDLVFSFIE